MIKKICAITIKNIILVLGSYVFAHATVMQLNPAPAPYPVAMPLPMPAPYPMPAPGVMPVGAIPAPIPMPIMASPQLNQPAPIIVQNIQQPPGLRPQMVPIPLNGAIPIPNGAIPIPNGMPLPNSGIPMGAVPIGAMPSGMPIPIPVGAIPIPMNGAPYNIQPRFIQPQPIPAPVPVQTTAAKSTGSVTQAPVQPINNAGLPEITKVYDPQNAPKEPEKIDPLLKPTRVITPQIKQKDTAPPTNLAAPMEIASIDTAAIKPVQYKPEPVPELAEAEQCYVPPPAPKKEAPKPVVIEKKYVPPPAPKKEAPKPVVIEKKEEKPKKKKGKKKKGGKKKKKKKGKKAKGKAAEKADEVTAEADSEE